MSSLHPKSPANYVNSEAISDIESNPEYDDTPPLVADSDLDSDDIPSLEAIPQHHRSQITDYLVISHPFGSLYQLPICKTKNVAQNTSKIRQWLVALIGCEPGMIYSYPKVNKFLTLYASLSTSSNPLAS